MSTDAKDISRRFYEEIINQKNVDAIDRFCAADFVDHNPPPGGKGSLDATKQQFLELVAAFPDLKMIVQDQIAEGDRVVNRVLVRGTHKGEYMGIPGRAGRRSKSAASISSAWSTERLLNGGAISMT